MADDVEQGSAELSTDETTEVPIEVPFEERVSQQLDALVKDIRDTNARMSGIQGIYDRNTAEINALRQAFTEGYGTSKKALSLFEQFVRSSQGEEAWKDYEEQQEIQDLRDKAKRPPQDATSKDPPPPTPSNALWDKRQNAFYGPVLAEVHEFAQQKGFALDLAGLGSVFGTKFQKLEWGAPTDADDLGARPLVKAMKDIITQEAVRLRAQAKPRVTPAETLRGTGGSADARTAYLEALRTGARLPTAAEIDKITAEYATT